MPPLLCVDILRRWECNRARFEEGTRDSLNPLLRFRRQISTFGGIADDPKIDTCRAADPGSSAHVCAAPRCDGARYATYVPRSLSPRSRPESANPQQYTRRPLVRQQPSPAPSRSVTTPGRFDRLSPSHFALEREPPAQRPVPRMSFYGQGSLRRRLPRRHPTVGACVRPPRRSPV